MLDGDLPKDPSYGKRMTSSGISHLALAYLREVKT
jgi:hypothetical protein